MSLRPTRGSHCTTQAASHPAKDGAILRRRLEDPRRLRYANEKPARSGRRFRRISCMYTPAEESGLSGQRLAARVQNAIDSIPHDEMIGLIRSIRREAEQRHLVYQRDGVNEIINLLPSPITVRPDQ